MHLQFYNVEVKILPPEGNGMQKIRSVLRRYNHFTKLHTKVIFSFCIVAAVTLALWLKLKEHMQDIFKCRRTK